MRESTQSTSVYLTLPECGQAISRSHRWVHVALIPGAHLTNLKKMLENTQPVEVESNSPSAANHQKMAHLYLILWCQNIMPVGSG